jgi:hypothetical protein
MIYALYKLYSVVDKAALFHTQSTDCREIKLQLHLIHEPTTTFIDALLNLNVRF